MNTPLVTVLTAVRNGARHLPATIESIQQQTFADWEYIVVDDNSTDNTTGIVETFRRADARIRLLKRQKAAGPYVAANDGLRVARGKYIIRTDGDYLSPSDRIEKQLAFLAAHPEYRACVTYWQAINDDGQKLDVLTSIPNNPRVFRWALLLRSHSLHSSICYEKSAMEEIGNYRELPLSQDYRLLCEMTRRGWLGTIPKILSYVRFHGTRQSHRNTDVQRDLALDVLSDHILALTGARWSREDLLALRSVGYSELMPVGKGLEMLDRWDRLWQSATDLNREDRVELARMSAFRRWKHLRSNARRQPGPVLSGMIKLVATMPQHLVPALRETAVKVPS